MDMDVTNVEMVAMQMGFEEKEEVDRYKVDLAHTRIIVTAWPDNRWPIEISLWIEDLMKDVVPARPDYRISLRQKNIVCARNIAIRDAALGSDRVDQNGNPMPRFEWFIFLDKDVRPNPKTTQFLNLEADVKCCQVKQDEDDAYAWPNDFHESIWCTSRGVLEAIKPPWFHYTYTKDGCGMVGCICGSFRRKVLDAGFSIAHGGWAEHDRDKSWC